MPFSARVKGLLRSEPHWQQHAYYLDTKRKHVIIFRLEHGVLADCAIIDIMNSDKKGNKCDLLSW